jgi:hypothetical protein
VTFLSSFLDFLGLMGLVGLPRALSTQDVLDRMGGLEAADLMSILARRKRDQGLPGIVEEDSLGSPPPP